jgi:hypothetical protein
MAPDECKNLRVERTLFQHNRFRMLQHFYEPAYAMHYEKLSALYFNFFMIIE